MGIVPVAFFAAKAAGVGTEIHLESNQFGRKVGQPIKPALRKPKFDHHVLTLNPTEITKSSPKCPDDRDCDRARTAREKTYPASVLRRLRIDRRRGSEQQG